MTAAATAVHAQVHRRRWCHRAPMSILTTRSAPAVVRGPAFRSSIQSRRPPAIRAMSTDVGIAGWVGWCSPVWRTV